MSDPKRGDGHEARYQGLVQSKETREPSATHDNMDFAKSVLFISYIFPPLGGSGVQRNLKHAKYLPRFGWTPLVLTVKDISYHTYDPSLLADVSSEVHVYRTESLDPLRLAAMIPRPARSNKVRSSAKESGLPIAMLRTYRFGRDIFAFPDAQVGWIPFILAKGLQLIRKHDIEVILARSVPYSGAIAAYLLSRMTGRPYVLDFADGWVDDPYLPAPTGFHRRGHRYLERQVAGSADHLIVYSEPLGQLFSKRYPWLDERITVIPNGYDPADLQGVVPQEKAHHKSRIVYMGSLYEHQEQNLLTFLEALRSLPDDVLNSLEVIFVGRILNRAIMHVEDFGLSQHVNFLGYLSHDEALSYLASADAALLFIRQGDKNMVTGKIFEYLGMCLPVIGVVDPKSLGADILRKVEMGQLIVSPDDVVQLTQILDDLVRFGLPKPSLESMKQFDREHNTARLASILDISIATKPNKKNWTTYGKSARCFQERYD